MASIQKRGKTYQYTVSRMINRKAKPIRKGGFRTKKEAKLAAAEIEVQLGKGLDTQLKPVPIDEYFDNWMRLYKSHLSEATQKHYEYTSKAIKSYFGSTALQEIKRHDYQLFLNNFGSNKSKESIEKINGHIRACVKDATEEQIIPYDFTRRAVITWKIPPKKSAEKHLDFKESELLLKEILKKLDDGLIYSLLLLGLTSGLRFAEMVGLTRSDFNFVKGTITVNKTWGYLKRSAEGFKPTKNEYSERIIKMDLATMSHFQKLFERIPTNSQNLIFYNAKSKYKVISNTLANTELRKLLNTLCLRPITIHGLRHTHASMLLYKKVSIYYVSERLGHSDIETTLKKYAHIVKELRKEDENKTINIFHSMS